MARASWRRQNELDLQACVGSGEQQRKKRAFQIGSLAWTKAGKQEAAWHVLSMERWIGLGCNPGVRKLGQEGSREARWGQIVKGCESQAVK